MTHISVPIKIVHTTKTAALNQPRFRKCTRERRACQFSPYFRGPPNCTMFTVGHVAGDVFRGSQLDSLSWCALCHLLYLSQCSHYLASHMEIKECFNVFQCHITFYIRSIWFIHASFLSVPFNVWLDNCNQLRSMNHFQGMHLEKERMFACNTHGIKWICTITCHTCHKASLCLVLTMSLCAPRLEFWKKVIQQVFEANPNISSWTGVILFSRFSNQIAR